MLLHTLLCLCVSLIPSASSPLLSAWLLRCRLCVCGCVYLSVNGGVSAVLLHPLQQAVRVESGGVCRTLVSWLDAVSSEIE